MGFFFQAEDGIRAGHVTGVQTCALPISLPRSLRISLISWLPGTQRAVPACTMLITRRSTSGIFGPRSTRSPRRSEERRVGKEEIIVGGVAVKNEGLSGESMSAVRDLGRR